MTDAVDPSSMNQNIMLDSCTVNATTSPAPSKRFRARELNGRMASWAKADAATIAVALTTSIIGWVPSTLHDSEHASPRGQDRQQGNRRVRQWP